MGGGQSNPGIDSTKLGLTCWENKELESFNCNRILYTRDEMEVGSCISLFPAHKLLLLDMKRLLNLISSSQQHPQQWNGNKELAVDSRKIYLPLVTGPVTKADAQWAVAGQKLVSVIFQLC